MVHAWSIKSLGHCRSPVDNFFDKLWDDTRVFWRSSVDHRSQSV
jgi:hypothetical protein